MYAIANRQSLNLTEVLRDRFQLYKAEELSIAQASQLIDELKAAVSVFEVPFDAALLDRTLRIIERVWDSISAGDYYPVPTVMNCPSCPYRGRCAQWNG